MRCLSRLIPLLALAACRTTHAPPPLPAPLPAPPPAAAAPPARWLFTDRLGVAFDGAGHGAALPRREPALLDGVRVLLDGGFVVGSARHAERFLGFRSIPARLGGGTLVWSEGRTYRAEGFLDEAPRPIVDVGSLSGARPWLGSMLLTTGLGLFEMDPATLSVRRLSWPGTADAIALDASRAARLDLLGRVALTTDGGRTFVDVVATKGTRFTEVRDEDGALRMRSFGVAGWELGPGGLAPIAPRRVRSIDAKVAPRMLDAIRPPNSRALPPAAMAEAVAWGVRLPGRTVLVAYEGLLRVYAEETALPVAEVEVPAVDERLARCQAVAVTDGGAPIGHPVAFPSQASGTRPNLPPPHTPPSLHKPALACAGEAGAHVITFDGALSRPTLDATFGGEAGGFIAGPHGRIAFDGRCGPADPRPTDIDLRSGNDEGSPPREATDDADAGPASDEARVCIRSTAGHWIERRIAGEDARRLYRWVPGDDGAVTALILGDGGNEAPQPVPEGVRVIRLDPGDPALLGGAFPAPRAPSREGPRRTADVDFWQDEDGAIRGWVRLAGEGEEKPPAIAVGPAKRMLRVVTDRSGRWAGVRIDPAGKVTVMPLPDGVDEVVTGGPFALATAKGDLGLRWFETTDGGAQWTPIEGPPAGRIELLDEGTAFGCSVIGCALGNGLVRVGWGSPPPSAVAAPAFVPAVNPRPRAPDEIALRCRLEGDPPWSGPATPGPVTMALAAAKGTALGALRGDTWSGEVVLPFDPASAPRRISASHRTLRSNLGRVVPILAAGAQQPVDLLLLVGGRRMRATGPATLEPHEESAEPTIAAELPGGALALLDVSRGALDLARGPATTPLVRLTLPGAAARTRLTLGRKATGEIAIVGYSQGSGEVFASRFDLGRADAGPPRALADLGTLAVCAPDGDATRFIADLSVAVRIDGRGGAALLDQPLTARVLIAGSEARLCVEGVEAALPKGNATALTVRMGKGGRALTRSGGKSAPASCGWGRR